MTDTEVKAAPPPAEVGNQPDRTTLLAFAGFVLLGGGASIAIRFTYGELAPFWSGALRFSVAAIFFWIMILIRRMPLPRGRALTGAVLFGVLSIGGALMLVYYGLTKTPASIYQTIGAIGPLLTFFFAAAHGLEKLHLRGVAGGLLAVVGITVALSGSLSAGVELSLPHILAIIAGSACFAEAGVVVKLFPRNHPYITNAIGMTVGALMLLVVSLIAGEAWTLPSTLSVWLALIYLIVGVTIAVFLLYLFVLGRWTASGTSFGFVLIPIVTVILATFLTDETITPIFLAGAALVLLGVYVGALMPGKKAAVEPAVEAPPAEPAIEPPSEPVLEPALAVAGEDIQSRPGLPSCF